jgi:hypothetical protein
VVISRTLYLSNNTICSLPQSRETIPLNKVYYCTTPATQSMHALYLQNILPVFQLKERDIKNNKLRSISLKMSQLQEEIDFPTTDLKIICLQEERLTKISSGERRTSKYLGCMKNGLLSHRQKAEPLNISHPQKE